MCTLDLGQSSVYVDNDQWLSSLLMIFRLKNAQTCESQFYDSENLRNLANMECTTQKERRLFYSTLVRFQSDLSAGCLEHLKQTLSAITERYYGKSVDVMLASFEEKKGNRTVAVDSYGYSPKTVMFSPSVSPAVTEKKVVTNNNNDDGVIRFPEGYTPKLGRFSRSDT